MRQEARSTKPMDSGPQGRRPCVGWFSAVFAVFALAAGSGSISAQQVRPGITLDDLQGLAGCWQLRWNSGVIDEQWMRPAAGMMMGMSRTIRSGEVSETERMVIRESADGLEYVADPSGQREAVFVATATSDSEWIFANEEHDFPQRIVYRLSPEDLATYIEGEEGGETRRVDFPMVRVQCRQVTNR